MRSAIYRHLLKLYPAGYRAKFGEEMADVVAEMLAEAPNGAARSRIWLRIAADYPASVLSQHLEAAVLAWSYETPNYVKRNGLIAGLLLVPFAAAVTANALDSAFSGQTLYHSWLWSTPVIQSWVGWLPQTALVITFISWLIYVWNGRKADRLTRAFDVRHAWPVMLTGTLACGILFMLLFHDSVHCWVHNPVHVITHFSQSLQCSNQGFLGGSS
jgi:hypothetical protein